ncbi:hypothetical protein B0H67DRAFT_483049 [Lasiosphaeris hirsuta]|uniref:Carrier domain-containing protein n=1 Tax=Lasiosphaeris hirsuta TaxID=260670 RepID=A0AA40AY47_9PEZI|nr:hypothetical protein B0H67DRAFT_483049 [Lasiosphaeris hirsuta]
MGKQYSSLVQFLRPQDKPALFYADQGRPAITHRRLYDFVDTFTLPLSFSSSGRKPVVCIALPNGPILAAAVLAVANRFTAAPINPEVGAEQFEADVQQAGASCVLTTREDAERLGLTSSWSTERQTPVFFLEEGQGDSYGPLATVSPRDGRLLTTNSARVQPNGPDDMAIILFTSGTSGTKKIVPITVHNIVAGVAYVISSWALTADDVCLNMMPLHHIGGLVRNIFAPVVSGGSTICCPAFDPSTFWDVVEDLGASWYYASPSMHQMVLDQAEFRPEALAKSRIRLVCNAAGGLLPALAERIRDTFKCIVLPSYGMTECMPISTPPIDYKLDRPGTSGIAVGPELAILGAEGAVVLPGTVGRISVRGEPVFPGYLKQDGTIDRSCFTRDGWFDTGDLGYMSADGFLFITGRSKEVINRGGEIISPFEVENAIISVAQNQHSPIYGRVTQALAFSAKHDVLQEVVGVVLVTPPGAPRVDIRQLHQALRECLQQAKWPALVVYMDDLPKRNNKVLRIRLGDRLDIPEVTDNTQYSDLHREATCPEPDTELSVNIPSKVCDADQSKLSRAIQSNVPRSITFLARKDPKQGVLELFLIRNRTHARTLSRWSGSSLIDALKTQMPLLVDGYSVPHKYFTLDGPVPLDANGKPQYEEVKRLLDAQRNLAVDDEGDSTAGRVATAFGSILDTPSSELDRDTDFFALGGDSLRAGKLLSSLRSEFGVALPIVLVFRDGSINRIAKHIDKKLQESASNSSDSAGADSEKHNQPSQTETCSSTNPFLLLFQLIPLLFLYPARRGVQWTLFLVLLANTKTMQTSNHVMGRLLNVAGCLLLTRLCILIVIPFVGIFVKWLVIWRHREGIYPMWGGYHTRWWIVQKTVDVCGLGVWSTTNFTRVWFYRLLGAKIGKGVLIDGAQLGEWDLIDIGDNTVLEACNCRPFASERNTSMYLGRITIGQNAYVGRASILAPGVPVPDNTCIGPNSSSRELNDATEANRDLGFHKIPEPHWALTLFGTLPLFGFTRAIHSTPWLLALLGLVSSKPETSATPFLSIIHWFAGGQRVFFHFLALILNTIFGPFFLFATVLAILAVLDLMFGKLGPSRAESRGQVERWRLSLIRTIFPNHSLTSVTSLFGAHYEFRSIILRILGAKVGKRVYWPGTGPHIGDYHLLDIGDDVVFGGRAHLVTSDGNGSEVIKVRAGAMIADRVVCLPGVTVGEQTVLGSGALTRRNKNYPAQGVFVGSRNGEAVCLSSGKDLGDSDMSTLGSSSSGDLTSRSDDGRRRQSWSSAASTAAPSESSTKFGSRPQTGDGHHEMLSSMTDPEKAVPLSRLERDTTTAPQIETESPTPNTLSPFSRAFYLRQAPYYVLGQFAIFLYTTFIRIFIVVYWNAPFVVSVQVFDRLYRPLIAPGATLKKGEFTYDMSPLVLFGLFTSSFAFLTLVQSIIALAITIAGKWAVIGRRKPGNYSWDVSSYCQRWQLYITIEALRRDCFRGNGILGMLTGTHWCVLYFRALGAKIGKDCALFANGRPSLMFTEPDLINMGDRVVVDDASLVGHINSKGKFDLNMLHVGDRCVLRTGSRLLSGGTMMADSCLLEHTLIMGGDTVDEGVTMQGWPADVFEGKRIPR